MSNCSCTTRCEKNGYYSRCYTEKEYLWCHKCYPFFYIISVLAGINVIIFIISRFFKRKTSILSFILNLLTNFLWSVIISSIPCLKLSDGITVFVLAVVFSPWIVGTIYLLPCISSEKRPSYIFKEFFYSQKSFDEMIPYIQKIHQLSPIIEVIGDVSFLMDKNFIRYKQDNQKIQYESWENQAISFDINELNDIEKDIFFISYRPRIRIEPDSDVKMRIEETKDTMREELNAELNPFIRENHHIQAEPKEFENVLFIRNNCNKSLLKKLSVLYVISVILGYSQIFELIWFKHSIRIIDISQKVVSLIPRKYRCSFEEPDYDEPQNKYLMETMELL